MKALWQLWLQPWRHTLVLTAAGQLLWLMAVLLILLNGGYADGDGILGGLSTLAAGAFFAHLAQGQTLRECCRPESFLLPRFRQRLCAVALLDIAQWVGLPLLLATVLGERAHGALIATALLGMVVLGWSIGSGRRVGLLIWVIALAAGWMPELAADVLHAVLVSPFTVPLSLVLIGWLLWLTLHPLLRISDPEADASPLESLNLGQGNAPPNGAPQPRGAFGKYIAGWFDLTSQYALDGALARHRRRPGARQRLALIRHLLLPHDNPLAIALRLALVATVVTAYFLLMQQRQHVNAAVAGSYAILLSLARFPQLGRGMLRMRPNLADLYLTLAPITYADYQKTIADALLWLVPVSVLTALAYTLLGIALLHASEPYRMLLATLIVALAASLVALAVHLIGPESNLGRALVNIAVVLGALISYWGVYWLIGALGYAIGGGVATLLTWSFGLSVWFAAQREYQRRLPCFDLPI